LAWHWPRSARQARLHAILLAIVLWVTLIVTLAAGSGDRSIAGPIKGPDFLQFYTMGWLVRAGQTDRLYDFNAFHQTQVALVPESGPEFYPPVYPPQAALLFLPLSRLSFRHATLLWNVMTIVMFGLIVRSAWRPVAKSLPDSLFVVASAAAFPPFWSLILHGQATILILTAFWMAWLALEQRKSFVAGMAFGLLLIKPQFAIPIAVVVLACREWRMLAGAATAIVVQVAAVRWLLGWSVLEAYGRFVPVIMQHADLLEPKPYQSHSLRALTRLAPLWIGLPAWMALSAIVLVCAVNVWRTSAPVRVRLGVVILASVLVSPHLIMYDATVLVLSLMWFGPYVQERCSRPDTARFWTCVYWLFVTLLAPTAAAIAIQVSVLVMIWLLILIARAAVSDGHNPSVEATCLVGADYRESLTHRASAYGLYR
jgi:alpha-1,2-mannosyltransferase